MENMTHTSFRAPLKIPILRQTCFFSRSSFVRRGSRLLLRTACISSQVEAWKPVPYNKVYLGSRSSLL